MKWLKDISYTKVSKLASSNLVDSVIENQSTARITFLAYFLNYLYTNLSPGNNLVTILECFKLSTSVWATQFSWII